MALTEALDLPELRTASSAVSTTVATRGPFRVVILMPVYRDWESAALVCRAIDEHLASLSGVSVRILLVDDGSPEDVQDWDLVTVGSLARIDVLRLHRNVGHQRAICAGVCYVQDHISSDAVLIMDADGEDRPENAVHLIENAMSNRRTVLFAGRRKRLEGIVFRIGYAFFRRLHRLLTGVPVRVGNFSILPSSVLSRLTSMPEMWNHYAGAVFKSKCHFEIIPMDRGRRVRGRSHMNFSSLVTHGLSGIASFQETVATRILIANAACLVLLVLALGAVIGIRLFTSLAIPGWATYTVGIIAILFTQILAVSFSLVFSLISNRSSTAFIPSRDCPFVVDRLDPLVSQNVNC